MQHLVGIDGVGATALLLGQQGGQPHFLKQVEPIVARRTVGAETDVDSLGGQPRNRSNATGKLEIRTGTVGHGTAVLGEQFDFVGFEMNCVCGNQTRTQQTQAAETFDRAHAETLQTVVYFLCGFV